MKLLTTGNPKTAKGEGYGVLTAILHLAPYTLAGKGNVCPSASPGCAAACLNLEGRGGIFAKGSRTNMIQEARIRKTRMLFEDRAGFLQTLRKEIRAHERRATRNGLRAAVRLNGTSDLSFESLFPSLFAEFPGVTFYDYTKNARRMRAYLAGEFPANYSLTFSRSEVNQVETEAILSLGGNVAIPFATRKGESLPATWSGVPVIDGDVTDLRFTDPSGVIVGLRHKSRTNARRAEAIASGFVLPVVSPSLPVASPLVYHAGIQ